MVTVSQCEQSVTTRSGSMMLSKNTDRQTKYTPLVSVAMCTYNGERFLAQQLDSIINQTYTNIEIVICDDGSTDKTIQMIQEYQKKFATIKLYQNKTNLGFVQNFAKAISLTTGDYVATSDQDDIWLKNKIEILEVNLRIKCYNYTTKCRL